MPRPVIGITLDSEDPGGYSNLPWYALRENYASAVTRAGGLPMALPHETDEAEEYLAHLDGLIVTGGAFDVDPALFGAGERHPTVITKDRRTAFELAVTKGAIARDMPVLGICGGQQLLHVVLGGALIQHIGHDGVAQSELAQRAGMTKQAVQQHLDDLVEDGILERVVDDGDARRKLVRFTDRGFRALEVANIVKRQIEGEYLRSIGQPDMETLQLALRAIIGADSE